MNIVRWSVLAVSVAVAACGSAEMEPQLEELTGEQEQSIGGPCPTTCKPTVRCYTVCEDPNTLEMIDCRTYGVCNPDWDNDGRNDEVDNCPNHYNPGQEDCDGDGWGNACDGENARYYVQAATLICDGNAALHAYGYSVEFFRTVRYRDSSACGAPDRYVKEKVNEVYCFNYSAQGCCMQGSGPNQWDPRIGYCNLSADVCGPF